MESADEQTPFLLFYMPMHEVAPKAVRMAVATDAMICTIHLKVSFFVMVNFYIFSFLHFLRLLASALSRLAAIVVTTTLGVVATSL